MKHFSMANQKAMALDITYPFGRRFAKAEYWENVYWENAIAERMFKKEQEEAIEHDNYWMLRG